MKSIFIILHILVCFALILVVLLQKGKGSGMGAAFGGSSQTVFGSAGASPFLIKVTTAVAILFMFTSLTLSFFFGHGPATAPSVMENAQETAPVASPDSVPAAPSDAAPVPAGGTQEGQQ